ncbi:AMP-dependent synthetase [Streptomyces sp. AJS327]|uniref:class I adenylate-forming enzyme family protein n=1 Tax=Streptomyces sp. AJS327 TaxID=2545265 RepID=UPI0015DD7753|nr:AMP-binding protein [Streptomyces sp. AJS327]MBA0050903.1 AMP-dependent synthetase [Streptomyces sp. AJS327]
MRDPAGSVTSLTHRLRQHGDHEALVIDDSRLTYARLADQVEQEQAVLASLGLRAGSRLGLLTHNSAQMVVSLLAAWERGVVVVPLNTRYRSDEISYVVEHSDIEAILTTSHREGGPDLLHRLSCALPGAAAGLPTEPTTGEVQPGGPTSGMWERQAPRLRVVAVRPPDAPGGAEPATTWLDTSTAHGTEPTAPTGGPTGEPPAGDGLVGGGAAGREQLLIYTSGTTSHPKGCVLDLDAFLATARHTAAAMGVGAGDVVWDPLPFFHTGGLLPMLGALDVGATFCSTAHFEAEEALAVLERERVTAAYPAFSTLITALLDAPRFAERDLSALRWILAIGPQALLERVQSALPGAVQVSCYGCTEMGGVGVYHDMGDSPRSRATTSGHPFDGVEVRVVDPAGTPVAPGTKGEIVVRGRPVLRRYHRDPVPPVDDEGWFHTGDLGTWDGTDLVYLGRLKDVFKVGGENVGAAEIEYVLLKHPAVTMAAAVPVPDARLGEVPVAFVELRPGHTTGEDELIAFCGQRLSAFKVPRAVRFVTEWPMSATKIQKFRLREALLGDASDTPDTPGPQEIASAVS